MQVGKYTANGISYCILVVVGRNKWFIIKQGKRKSRPLNFQESTYVTHSDHID